jgi:hypothetical protein
MSTPPMLAATKPPLAAVLIDAIVRAAPARNLDTTKLLRAVFRANESFAGGDHCEREH